MSSPEWDVIVVGAGPAGCAAAAAAVGAHPEARVLLVDRANFPRDKVCGDGIAAAALDLMPGIGIDPAPIVAGFPAVERLILRSPRGVLADRLARPASWVVPREVFDARLRSAVLALGVQDRRHRVRGYSQTSDGVVVDGLGRAGTLVIATGSDHSVAAAGSSEPVRADASGSEAPGRTESSRTGSRRTGSGGRHPAPAMAIGLRGYARTELTDAQALCLSDVGWPAYAWSFPIGDGWANVGYGEMTRPGRTLNRERLLSELHRLTPGLLSEPGRLRGHRLALAMRPPLLGQGRVLHAGDAAALINPLSGEGIYDAIRSGVAAGRAAVTADPIRHYRAAMAPGGRHQRHAAALTSALRRAPRLLEAGISTAARDQRSFEDLLQLTLADGPITARLLRGVGADLLRATARRTPAPPG